MRIGASPVKMAGTRLVVAIAMSTVLISMHRVTTFYTRYFTAEMSGQHPIANDMPLTATTLPLSQSTNQASPHSSRASNTIDLTPNEKIISEAAHNHSNVKKYQSYEDDETDPKRAIVIISTGETASSTTMVERFVYSARNIGNFNGWIILITDADADRYHNLSVAAFSKSKRSGYSMARTRLGDRNEVNKFLVFRTQEEQFASISKFAKFKAENTMSSKIFKTYILEYANKDERLNDIELFYYLDVDIVFGNPVRPLFTELEQRYKIGNIYKRNNFESTKNATAANTAEESKEAKIYFFKGNRGQKIQGGQFVLDRTRSQPCLDRWRQLMLEQRNITYLKDQTQLTMMLDEQRERKKNKTATKSNTDCNIKLMKQNNTLIQFPELSDITRWRRRRGKEPPVLVHFRNSARVMKNVDEESLERYMRELLRFKWNQLDKYGILGKMLLKVDRKEKNTTDTTTNN